jgi:hypothetical protein
MGNGPGRSCLNGKLLESEVSTSSLEKEISAMHKILSFDWNSDNSCCVLGFFDFASVTSLNLSLTMEHYNKG